MVPEAEADRMFNWPVRVLIPVPDWVYAPSLDIPEIPVKAPDVDMSQSDVLIEPVSPLSPRVKVLLAVKAPLAVNPDVAVIRPEMVGVAVQAVGEMVREEPVTVVRAEALPKVMAPSPEYVVPLKVMASIVAEADAVVNDVWPVTVRLVPIPTLPVKEPLPLMFNPVPVIPAAVNDLVTFNEPRKLLDPVERPEKVPVNVSLPFTVRLPPIEA